MSSLIPSCSSGSCHRQCCRGSRSATVALPRPCINALVRIRWAIFFQRRSLTYTLRLSLSPSTFTAVIAFFTWCRICSTSVGNSTLSISARQLSYSSWVICSGSMPVAHSSAGCAAAVIMRSKLSSLAMLWHSTRTMKRSHNASRPSPRAGNSLLAATSSFSGRRTSCRPLRNSRSLMAVSSVFWMAGPAFQISSRNTTSAVGR